MTDRDVGEELAALQKMTAKQLRERYSEVFGETARSGNRQWLLRRVAWRIQMLAEGDLAARAMDRARERARELARDADLRLRPPKDPILNPGRNGSVTSSSMAIRRDERIPPPPTVLRRVFKGHEYCVTVMPNGFEYDGGLYRSLSAVAYAITGSHWNGLYFFGLAQRKPRSEVAT